MEFILFMIIAVVFYITWSYFIGNRKNSITLDLDNRYSHFPEYVKAVQKELEQQGRNVEYLGNGNFLIDGKKYEMHEANAPIGIVPLQRTILKKVNESNE